MPEDFIHIYGAREHNLRDLSLKLPRNKLVVFCGVSGSGKSSLAFDTIDLDVRQLGRRHRTGTCPRVQ